ncbi:MAG TPA: hypothetical protein VGI54_09815 [Solirubrobacteraceae bacterium]|jgi:hypothetical protein
MLSRSLLLALIAAALAPAAAAAQPTVALDRGCYFATATQASPELSDTVHVTGAGFPKGRRVSVTVRGVALAFTPGSATRTGSDGALDVTVASPHVAGGVHRRTLVVTVRQTTASVPLYVTDFGAFVHPSAKPGAKGLSPRRKVTINLLGWGVGRPLYVHFVAPGAKRAKQTVKLGTAAGHCGELTVHRRHFWPFAPHRAGAWHVQFDARRRYAPTTQPSVVEQSVIALSGALRRL